MCSKTFIKVVPWRVYVGMPGKISLSGATGAEWVKSQSGFLILHVASCDFSSGKMCVCVCTQCMCPHDLSVLKDANLKLNLECLNWSLSRLRSFVCYFAQVSVHNPHKSKMRCPGRKSVSWKVQFLWSPHPHGAAVGEIWALVCYWYWWVGTDDLCVWRQTEIQSVDLGVLPWPNISRFYKVFFKNYMLFKQNIHIYFMLLDNICFSLQIRFYNHVWGMLPIPECLFSLFLEKKKAWDWELRRWDISLEVSLEREEKNYI